MPRGRENLPGEVARETSTAAAAVFECVPLRRRYEHRHRTSRLPPDSETPRKWIDLAPRRVGANIIVCIE